MKCLCCGREFTPKASIEEVENGWHKKCVKAFFGGNKLPLSLSACSDDDGMTVLQINEVTHSVFYAPLYLADALGYFKEENIKIELALPSGKCSTKGCTSWV